MPFDVETVTLRLQADPTTFTVNVGTTDRLDIGAAGAVYPVVAGRAAPRHLSRVTSGPGVGLRHIVRGGRPGDPREVQRLPRTGAVVWRSRGELRLPTGDPENLLGGGEVVVRPRVIGSFEAERVGVHGEVGYAVGGLSRELTYGGAVAVVALPTLTVIGELSGRRYQTIGRLEEIVAPHPRL